MFSVYPAHLGTEVGGGVLPGAAVVAVGGRALHGRRLEGFRGSDGGELTHLVDNAGVLIIGPSRGGGVSAVAGDGVVSCGHWLWASSSEHPGFGGTDGLHG